MLAPPTYELRNLPFARTKTLKLTLGSTYATPGMAAISLTPASSRMRVGDLLERRSSRRSPSGPRDERSSPARLLRPCPKTWISLKKSRALKRSSILRCRPSPNDIIVTITATPTITPIVVSVARSFAWRRFRRAKCNMSKKDITTDTDRIYKIGIDLQVNPEKSVNPRLKNQLH